MVVTRVVIKEIKSIIYIDELFSHYIDLYIKYVLVQKGNLKKNRLQFAVRKSGDTCQSIFKTTLR